MPLAKSPLHRLHHLFLAAALALLTPPAAAQLTPTTLRCESLDTPLAIAEPAPRLSWINLSDARSQRQTAYRILIASTPALLAADTGDLWDSGRVESSSNAHIPYAGAPLAPRQACHWKVMTWDAAGAPGPWSQPAGFEVGLLSAADWTAHWLDAAPRAVPVEILRATYYATDNSIRKDVTAAVAALGAANRPIAATNAALGGDPAVNIPKRLEVEYRIEGQTHTADVAENQTVTLAPAPIPLLRRAFDLPPSPVVKARLYATALGVYELHLNGQRVGDHHFSPGWTDYRRRVHYQVFDVTGMLRAGGNALAAEVGPGWFSGRAGLFHISRFYGDAPALLAQLEVTHADGTVTTITTDDQWRRHDGPRLYSDMMDGEVYDARAEIDGWREASFHDAAWDRAAVREENRTLQAAPDHPVRVLAELPALSVAEPAPGQWTFDLGQNMVGVVRLQVAAPVGTRITLRHAEMLNPDGTVYTQNLRGAPSIDTYTCRGGSPDGGPEVWQPAFTFHGFRYVEVTGLPAGRTPTTDMVTGIVLGSDLPERGTFVCSDPSLNQLQSNILWGLRGNYLSIPTDCPQRDERMGWTADTQVFAPTALWNVDAAPFLSKWLTDLMDAQREDGAYPDVAPNTRGLTFGVPGWADAGTVVPWTIYQMTGDTRILERNVDAMVRWVEWCRQHSTNLIRDRDRGNDYGDWLSINADTPKDLIGTAYFARSAQLTAEALLALGRDDEALDHQHLWEQIRDAFVARYIDDQGRIASGTQSAYLLALHFDLVPADLREAAATHLVADIRARGNRLSTGFLGVGLLLPVLSATGHDDVAADLIMQDAFPSWLYSVRYGATTIWERWNAYTPETGPHPDHSMNSFNHYSLGSCGEWLYAGIGGIRPDRPGFEHVVIDPVLAPPLTWAAASVETVRGRFATRWELKDGNFVLDVTVPVGATATVRLPASPLGMVLESGGNALNADGSTVVAGDDGVLSFEIGSGHYRYQMPQPPRTSGNPILPGWYADPEVVRFGDTAWIYPTTSARYDDQTYFDAFSSRDLVSWTRHPRILEKADIAWARRAMWAPSAIEHDGTYYLFFSANDIQNDEELGGIGVAASVSPAGPFADHIGAPLISAFHNGAQPIDQFVFRDADGSHYLIYGGWRHCNIARLAPDFRSLVPFDDGEVFKEMTPEGYVEGPFMFIRGGRYYFMWSEGGWTGPDYAVAYAVADSPLGPWRREGVILRQDPAVATGAGHHSVLSIGDEHYIVYHRRPLAETDANHRVVCIDRMRFDDQGRILPVQITFEGVPAAALGQEP